MSGTPAGTHEHAAVPKSPEQVFVEGLLVDAFSAYSHLYANRNEIADASHGFRNHRAQAQARQREVLLPLGDCITALAVLADGYEDPVARVAELSAEHNDLAALALYRKGHKDGAVRYLDDQLKPTSVADELAILAGLGDQEAANLLPSAVAQDDLSKVFELFNVAVSTAFLSEKDVVNLSGLCKLIGGTGIQVGDRRNPKEITQGELALLFTQFKYGAAPLHGEFLSRLVEASRTYDRSYSTGIVRVRKHELHEDAVRYSDLPDSLKSSYLSSLDYEVNTFSEEEKSLLRPKIDRELELLPFYPEAVYPRVVAEFAKLSPQEQQDYRGVMAVRIGQAGMHEDARRYFDQLSLADKIRVAYLVAAHHFDKGVRFEMPRFANEQTVDSRVLSALGQFGVTASRIKVAKPFEHVDRLTTDAIVSGIRAKIEIAQTGSSDAHLISPILQLAKLDAMNLGSDRERYDALVLIREAERSLAVLHSCAEPESMPPFDVWVQQLLDGNDAWLNGFVVSSELTEKK